ncbi:MAG: response regulator [Candidatus Hodarchaeales archaeon]|jgi:two-component system cell cycle response regulator
MFLTGEGYEVIQASSGEEALELAEKENPQIIIMDVKMPGIGGIETCSRLKTQEETGSIPIIMVTAHEDKDVEAFVEGADDFVIKPFSMDDVSLRVKSMLRVRHLTDEHERSLVI